MTKRENLSTPDVAENTDACVPSPKFYTFGEAAPLNITTEFWSALEASCGVQLSDMIRSGIVTAMRRYVMREVQETQNASPKQIDVILASLEKKAQALQKEFEKLTGTYKMHPNQKIPNHAGLQASTLLDWSFAQWPSLEIDQNSILQALGVLTSACHYARAGLPLDRAEVARKPSYAMLDELAPLYVQATGRGASYTSPPTGGPPVGPFVDFVSVIVLQGLPPQVQRENAGKVTIGSPAYLVKNWRDQ